MESPYILDITYDNDLPEMPTSEHHEHESDTHDVDRPTPYCSAASEISMLIKLHMQGHGSDKSTSYLYLMTLANLTSTP